MFQLQAKQLADADMPPRTQTQDLLRHVVAARVRQEHVQVWIFDRAHGFVAHPAGLAWFAEKREELSITSRTMREEEAHVRNSDVLGMPAGTSMKWARARRGQSLPTDLVSRGSPSLDAQARN
jgi:hypothetical protein